MIILSRPGYLSRTLPVIVQEVATVVIAESFPVHNVASVQGIVGGFGALGAVLFNFFVGEVMDAPGAENIFFVMAFLHPVALLILLKIVKPEKPQ